MSKVEETKSMAAEFGELVEPLELLARVRISGSRRLACIAAFKAHPDGVRQVVEDTYEQARTGEIRDPVRMLVWKISDGWHKEEPLPEPEPEPIPQAPAEWREPADLAEELAAARARAVDKPAGRSIITECMACGEERRCLYTDDRHIVCDECREAA